MTKAGSEILAGAQDALAYMQGDRSKGLAHRIIHHDIDVSAIRKKTGMTQQKFAETYGLSLSNIKKWESKQSEPRGAAKAYLTVIAQEPKIIKKALASALQTSI